MLNNEGMKSLIDEYGKRICAISLNNGKMLFLDYPGEDRVSVDDTEFKTVNGCDMLVIPRLCISYGRKLHYKSYITTEFIENVLIMDENDAMYRIDPLSIK